MTIKMPPSETPGEQPEPDKNESENEVLELPPMPTAATRLAIVNDPDFELNPASLFGSWFHRVENGNMVWQGVVVGEPQPGKYLVQVESSLEGAKRAKVQALVTLDQMLAKDEGYEYRFYDTQEEMKAAFAEYHVRESAFGE